ncbi:RNA polymerase II, Rpb4, core protein [Tasmannia lanceolata]|uniref:RNA polymerase II, Rpb4, core protein n=1 Tax=Tasmannia lanceolata TaxID=3420 RepID=UPI0040638363
MKIIEAKAGALTNFEVLDLLRSRGATSDPLGALGAVTPSECQVFDYLVQTAACNQTRESIDEFSRRSGKYKLSKAEKLNIVNIRPSSQPEIFPIIEDCENRGLEPVLEELVNMVVEILPPRPTKPGEEEDNLQGTEDQKTMEVN